VKLQKLEQLHTHYLGGAKDATILRTTVEKMRSSEDEIFENRTEKSLTTYSYVRQKIYSCLAVVLLTQKNFFQIKLILS